MPPSIDFYNRGFLGALLCEQSSILMGVCKEIIIRRVYGDGVVKYVLPMLPLMQVNAPIIQSRSQSLTPSIYDCLLLFGR